jgi:DNA-binding transcriptional MerR regulator
MAGYRVYSETDIHALRFIRRARDLGFTVEQIGELMLLWRDRSRASADVKRIALAHVEVLEAKKREIEEMAKALKHLARTCHGDGRPDCPIIEELAQGQSRPASDGHLGRGFEKLR